MTLDVRSDRSGPIRDSVRDVKLTLLSTVCLVVLVIFLFLRNVSATIIPSLALPGSIVATFAVMYLLGYSLDNLSLMALTLSVGFVVDDAIVMLENIVRHMEMGKPPMQAALDGSKEIAFTIRVDDACRWRRCSFRCCSWAASSAGCSTSSPSRSASAILVSGFVSISLTPMLCSRFLKPPHQQRHGRLYNAIERVFDDWLRIYDRTLAAALRFRAVTMVVSVALLAGTVYLFSDGAQRIPPERGSGPVQHQHGGHAGHLFDDMVRHQKRSPRSSVRIRTFPVSRATWSGPGGSGAASTPAGCSST